jgi:hypothetical protein
MPRSLRRLHGRMMERLAESGVRALAWDIKFPGETPFDETFVQGLAALKAKGIPTTVAVRRWWLDAETEPEISATIAPAALPGCAAAGISAEAPVRLQLMARRGPMDPLPSLVLAAFAAFRQPQAHAEYKLDENAQAIDIVYRQSNHGSRTSRRKYGIDRVRITHLLTSDDGSGAHTEQFGLLPDDALGLTILEIPSAGEFSSITVDYRDVFSAPLSQLRNWFAGRLVFVADLRGDTDRHPFPGGRTMPGCYAHVAGAAALLASAPIRATSFTEHIAVVSATAIIGVILGARRDPRRSRRWLITAGATLLLGALSIGLYRQRGYLLNPLPAVIALWSAVALAAGATRFVGTRPTIRQERSSFA